MKANGAITSEELLRKNLEDRKRRQTNLIKAIETGGDIPSLTTRLRDLEAEVAQIQYAIDAFRPVNLDSVLDGLREHITRARFSSRNRWRLGKGILSEPKRRLTGT